MNGARDLQIQNWFQESIAGRQCKGRLPDYRHRRPLDIQLTLAGHYKGKIAAINTQTITEPVISPSKLIHDNKEYT